MLFRSPPHRRIVLFDYIPSRTTEALKALLIGADGPFRGKLLTDGLELYDLVAEQLGLQHFGCAQHARTYFHKALKVTELPSGAGTRARGNRGLPREGI